MKLNKLKGESFVKIDFSKLTASEIKAKLEEVTTSEIKPSKWNLKSLLTRYRKKKPNVTN